MEYSDIIIIGGGAAGMMAAAAAGDALSSGGNISASVTLLEKMPRPGRKIMITGKGRCNLTNTRKWNEFSGHIHPKANPLKAAFLNFDSEAVTEFFGRHGLETVIERGERIFPASGRAVDVVDTLVRAVSEAGVKMHTGCEVSSVKRASATDSEDTDRMSDGAMPEGRFLIECRDGRTFSCSRLIIATGGLSYPATGSTGDGYAWARDMGHTIKRCFPSLTALVPENYKISSAASGPLSADASGLRTSNMGSATGDILKGHIDRSVPLSETGALLNGNHLKNVGLNLYADGKLIQTEFGDLDFTDGGLEGPIGFRISRKCVNTLINGGRVSVSIDLKPAVEKEALERRISSLWQEIASDGRNRGKKYEDRFRILLSRLLPSSLAAGFRRSVRNIDHKRLASALKDWKMDIRGFVGYERSVITAGGVSTDEIKSKTMESRLVPGLYFAGEVLDLDGDTGGYNLQTAFSTGFLAGQSAAEDMA